MNKKLFLIALMAILPLSITGCVTVVKIGEEANYTGESMFSASESVGGLWEQAKADIEGKALGLAVILEESGGDLKSLAQKYATGQTGSASYAVKGSATVKGVNQEKKAGFMTVELEGYSGPIIVNIQIGSIYKGSSTRDALDIISFGDYTNQQEWAAISKELHSKIDQDVIQALNLPEIVGKSIDFTGTFAEQGNDEVLITPISLNVK